MSQTPDGALKDFLVIREYHVRARTAEEAHGLTEGASYEQTVRLAPGSWRDEFYAEVSPLARDMIWEAVEADLQSEAENPSCLTSLAEVIERVEGVPGYEAVQKDLEHLMEVFGGSTFATWFLDDYEGGLIFDHVDDDEAD